MSALVDLAQRVAALERMISNLMRPGEVAEVDAAKSRARMRIGGTDEAPVLGPWTPYSQAAGGTKAHVPLTVGQQVMLFSPNGDPQQGMLVPMTFTDQNPAPGTKGDENAISFGKTVLTGDVELIGSLVVKGDLRASGGAFEHEGKDVGATHRHTQVMPGSGVSGDPQG